MVVPELCSAWKRAGGVVVAMTAPLTRGSVQHVEAVNANGLFTPRFCSRFLQIWEKAAGSGRVR